MGLTLGQIIGGHYEVANRLGGGGFGETYLAKDLHLPDHPCRVIKRLSPRIQEASVLQVSRRLFETEAQVLYRLGTHPQIPQLFAHFEESAEFYLVQEYIDGKDLSHELIRGKRWEQYAVAMLLQNLLTVLSFVHRNNVIHRDIKPENVIRRRDGQLFLIDFGVVKEITTSSALVTGQASELTNYTVGIGTPGYMPSEQAHGEPKFASDIYAIGMLGIQALTGILPNHLGKDDNLEILWRQHAPHISSEFADILSRMVRFDFRQRYANADDAYEAIKGFSDRHPISNINHSLPTIQTIPQDKEFPQPVSTHLKPITPPISQTAFSQIDAALSHPSQPPAPNAFNNSEGLLPTTTIPSNNSVIWQHLRPWHLGLGIVTFGAIIITALILIFGKSTPSSNDPATTSELQTENTANNDTLGSNMSPSRKVVLERLRSPIPSKDKNSINQNSPQNQPFKPYKLVGDLSNPQQDKSLIYGIKISPNGKIVAVANANQTIEIWDLQTLTILQVLKGHKGRVYDVYFSPDSKKLVSASDSREIIVWEVNSGKILYQLDGHQERIYTSIFSPDGKMVASSGGDSTIRLWDVETGKQIKLLQEKSWVYDVSFTPDSKTLVSGSKAGVVKIWNVQTGAPIGTLLDKGSAVRSIVYSKNGQWLASAMQDGSVRLWNTTTGKLTILLGHSNAVHTVNFSDDARLLASGSADKTVKIWSVQDGQMLQTLGGHEDGVSSVDFRANDYLLISGSLDGTVKIWQEDGQ
ncbi:MAG: serine/threonine-protein kinase [Pseudanabaenaceae cyanobacterium bins.39]|nr:serine/threonine-protein kinase [Pseudanabaenaceae cyanobacterium bins.39]